MTEIHVEDILSMYDFEEEGPCSRNEYAMRNHISSRPRASVSITI